MIVQLSQRGLTVAPIRELNGTRQSIISILFIFISFDHRFSDSSITSFSFNQTACLWKFSKLTPTEAFAKS